jgi:hypothetical protein
MSDVKETKELVVGLLKLSALLAEAFKDGVQAQDAVAIWAKIQSDEALKAALVEAYNGADKVKEELKDISVAEALEIVAVCIPEIKALIEAVAKK